MSEKNLEDIVDKILGPVGKPQAKRGHMIPKPTQYEKEDLVSQYPLPSQMLNNKGKLVQNSKEDKFLSDQNPKPRDLHRLRDREGMKERRLKFLEEQQLIKEEEKLAALSATDPLDSERFDQILKEIKKEPIMKYRHSTNEGDKEQLVISVVKMEESKDRPPQHQTQSKLDAKKERKTSKPIMGGSKKKSGLTSKIKK